MRFEHGETDELHGHDDELHDGALGDQFVGNIADESHFEVQP